jgi:hypothetical protein
VSRTHIASVVVLAAAFATASPREAGARDRWSRPYPGVMHLHRTWGPFDYHVLTIDLHNPRVRFVTTPESVTLPRATDPAPRHHWMQTTSFARLTHADIAINGNYYEIFHAAHSTCGLTMTDGQAWHSTYEDPRLDCVDSIGFGTRGRVTFFDSRDHLFGPAPEPWVHDVLTGSPRLLVEGDVVLATHPHHALSRNPRTALGLSRDGATLLMLVVNGREGHAQGMTCQEAARTLKSFGAWNAVNLDGGGSSSLYIRREHGLVSSTPDGYERPVGNHFGIVFSDAPEIEDSVPARDEPTDAMALRDLDPAPPIPVPTKRPKLASASSEPRAAQPFSTVATLCSTLAFGMVGGRRRRPRRK